MKNIIKRMSNELNAELNEYNAILKTSLKSEVTLINSIIKYVIKIKGKQFRPLLCILSAKLENEANHMTYLSAATVEMLHVATLLHDDVVDGANIRRKWPTINSIWKSKLPILIGDYMFSKSLSNIVKLNNLESINILAKIADRLSEGEILQIENSINKEMSEDVYFKMISDKTASLISASCKLGYMSVSESDKKNNIERFGEYLGIAYQLKDDLFDVLGKIDKIGKPTNLDLKKNILTLPYIHAINSLDGNKKRILINKLKFHSKRNDHREVRAIIDDFKGIDYTNNKIDEFSDKASKELSVFPDSKYKELLIDLLKFNQCREY